MSYLLDTNVISELTRPRPDSRVLAWFSQVPEQELFISVLTLGEVQAGIVRLPEGPKRNDLIDWFERLKRAFQSRILPVDATVSLAWGDLQAGRNLPVVDSLIAATALVGRMVLVTRNKPDFSGMGVEILDPWL